MGLRQRNDSEGRQEALIQAGLALASELSLPAVLQKIVDLACQVADATFGALGVLGEGGFLHDFITSGMSEEERRAIGSLPVGKGILGVLITDARPLRLSRIQDDPRSVGFPPEHPPMTSFLGVPIVVRGNVYGNLYLTEKRGGTGFSEEDERATVTLAAQAGVAIENARLFEEAQERLALEERHRLARELHDSVSQALFSITLQASAAQLASRKDGPNARDKLDRHLAELLRLTQTALSEMKALIFELRPEALQEEGMVAAIRKQADTLEARDELHVMIDAPKSRIALPPNVEEQLYRLAQEALNNIVKHARASNVKIWVRQDSDHLLLEIVDDGVGFEPSLERPGHLGLTTMAQRAARLGGRLEVNSEPGRGTTIRASVPLSITKSSSLE
jgi:signal transduction histidine kinase